MSAEQSVIELKIEALQKEVATLNKLVKDGNGKPSLIASVDGLLSKTANMEEKMISKLDSFEKNIALQLNNQALSLANKLVQLELTTNNIASQQGKLEAQQVKTQQEGTQGFWQFKTKTSVAVIGLLGTIFVSSVSAYFTSVKTNQEKNKQIESEITEISDLKKKYIKELEQRIELLEMQKQK